MLSFHPIEAVVRHLERLLARRGGGLTEAPAHQPGKHELAKIDSLRKDVRSTVGLGGKASRRTSPTRIDSRNDSRRPSVSKRWGG